MHAHTSGISKCCRISAEEVLNEALNIGIDGLVLTNHYQKSYIENGNSLNFAENYIKEYRYSKKLAEKANVKLFFGIEVTMELYRNVHMLIYGVPECFLKNNPEIYNLTQEELYKTVKEYNGAVIQAHPFRNGTTVLNTDYLDGIEINCHPLYKNSYSTTLYETAKKHNLALTCGGDFHADTYRPKCGIYLPESITNSEKLGEYLLSSNSFNLCIQEPYTENTVNLNYIKPTADIPQH